MNWITLFHAFVLLWLSPLAVAHQEPTSFLDLRIGNECAELRFTASTLDLAHDLEGTEPKMLLQPEVLRQKGKALAEILKSRLGIQVDGVPLSFRFVAATAVPERDDVRLNFTMDSVVSGKEIAVKCQLFPYDARHRTYLNVYRGQRELIRQEVFEGEKAAARFQLASEQGWWSIFREFVGEGIHHIFIGLDHILFVISLLLLGGNFRQLVKILTAFTVAHSITLGLATFHLLNPPTSIIEPVIALSIVVVGLHAYLGERRGDGRLAFVFAFAFGLIHGFGFANVLQEMQLPQHALGGALFAFNIGVELGQLCILIAVVPPLTWLKNRRPEAAQHAITCAALGVVTVGGFWFFERLVHSF